MAIFSVSIEVGDQDGLRFETLDAMVDTGAIYTSIPVSTLSGLDVSPSESREFELADGSVIRMDVGWTRIGLDGRVMPSPVVFAGDDVTPLLGAVTLEEFGLGVDPVNAKLIPVRPPM